MSICWRNSNSNSNSSCHLHRAQLVRKESLPVKAIEISMYGAPEVLRMVDRPDPVAGAGEVLIRVAASGVNRPDVLQRQGHYPVPSGASDVPGLEVAGVIESGDAEAMAASGLNPGDSVCALVSGGGYAQWCVAPAAQCLPVPQGLTLVEAASLPETFFTVWSNLFDRAGLQAGESCLIHGGTSGIGVAAIQLARVLGVRVLATAGSDNKCEACVGLGAEVAINYRTEDFVGRVKAATAGQGVDVVLDMVAGDYLARNIECLAEDGRLVIIALLHGAKGELDCGAVLRRRLRVTGSTLRPRSVAFKAEIARALHARVWPMLSLGTVKPVVHTVMPATQVVQAHQLLESSRHIGKIVLTWY